jgi:hypothetical protein
MNGLGLTQKDNFAKNSMKNIKQQSQNILLRLQ